MGFDQSVEAGRTHIHGRGMGGSENTHQPSNDSSDSLIDSMTDDVVFLDADGHIQTWNEEAKRIRGYTSDEIIGEHFSVFFRKADVKAGIPNRLLREADAEGHTREEGWHVRKDGSEFWVDVTLTALGEGEGLLGYAMTTQDTTQHHNEQDLLDEKAQLESLIVSMSHDLRNPLNVAQGNAELLKETGDLSRVDKITDALTHATELLNYLEQRAKDGKQIQELTPVELREVALTAWDVVETNQADLTVEADMTLMADHERLQQLLTNLFGNAIDHAGPEVTVTIGPLEEGGFYVEDNGPGIPETDRERIFEMGYSGEADSSGFGLAICTRIASAHRWSIAVTEQADGGARFELTGVTEVCGDR